MSGCPEPLEQIFRRVEEESERRAQDELGALRSDNLEKISQGTHSKRNKTRHRGSISISRIGQPNEDFKGFEDPLNPTFVATIASQSPFYQAQIANVSVSSFASGDPELVDDSAHAEDDNHVTQVHQIAARQSISQTMGVFLSRRLSRARSANVLKSGDSTVLIGVSVQEATVETPSEEGVTISRRASVHAPGSLRNQSSRLTMADSIPASSGWVTKAKEFTMKLRRQSIVPNLPQTLPF